MKTLDYAKEKHALFYEQQLRQIDSLYQSLSSVKNASKSYRQEESQINAAFHWAKRTFKTNLKAAPLYSDYASSESFVHHQEARFIIDNFGLAAAIAKIYEQSEIYFQHLITIANAYIDLGQLDTGITLYEEVAEQAGASNDDRIQAMAWALIGNAEGYRANYALATQSLEKALDLQNSDSQERGISLTYLASIYKDLGDYEKAITLNQAAANLHERFGNIRAQATSLDNIGNSYNDLGLFEQALSFHQQALSLLEQLDNVSGIAQSYEAMALIHMNRGHFADAQNLLEKSKAICKNINLPLLEGSILNHLAALHIYKAEYLVAEQYLESALKLAQQTQDYRLAANVVGNKGLVAIGLGRLEEGIAYHRKAFIQHRKIHDQRGYAKDLNHLGQAYSEKRDFNRALVVYRIAAEVFHKLGRRFDEAEATGNQVAIFLEQGHLEEAIAEGETALAIFQEIGAEQSIGRTLQNLGICASAAENKLEAIKYFEQAVVIFRKIDDQTSLRNALFNLAQSFDEASLYKEAMQIYQEIRALGNLNSELEAELLAAMAVIEHCFQNYPEAINLYLQAKVLFESNQNLEMMKWTELNCQLAASEISNS